MRFFEKLQQEHPEFIGEDYPGGYALCPSDMGYEKESPCPYAAEDMELFKSGRLSLSECQRCWEREMPEK